MRATWFLVAGLALVTVACGFLAAYGWPNVATGINGAAAVIALHAERQAWMER